MENKVILVGNSGVGKTSTVRHLLNSYAPITPTLGVDIQTYRSPNGSRYTLWDCAGKKELGGIRSGYYMGASIALIFHGGGENNAAVWEQEARRAAAGVQVYHITGTYEQKRAQVIQILV